MKQYKSPTRKLTGGKKSPVLPKSKSKDMMDELLLADQEIKDSPDPIKQKPKMT